MVRRRSTVRFRNGTPGHGQFSNGSNGLRGTSRKRRSTARIGTIGSSPGSESSYSTASAQRQVLKVAIGWPSRDSLVAVRARSRGGRSATGRAVMCRDGDQSVHAVRVREVLRPDGLKALPDALPTSSR